MREPRNPFRMRVSEQIESEATFLRLFAPGVLDVLPKDGLWDRVQIFRSAPGGGKTSLFRVFTPPALLTLHASRTNEDYRELYHRMESLGVVSDDGPHLLGVMLSCARNYAMLDDLSFNGGQKQRLLYSLLNARLILATLRGALGLKKLRYPSDLELLTMTVPAHGELPVQLPIPGSGKQLFDWASAVERTVCQTIDSFGPPRQDALEGHDTLHALSLIRPDCITYREQPVADRVLVMLDDVHKLTTLQRQRLLDTILALRPPLGLWIAERLEALNPDELLVPGATTGREYGEPIDLENFWRSSLSHRRFEKAVMNIADRRVKLAQDVEIGPFATSLQDSLDGTEWQSRFHEPLRTTSARIRKRVRSTTRYAEWIRAREELQGTPRERAIAWKTLEILIERDIRKAQLALDFSLPREDLQTRELSSAVRGAAEFLISQEFDIPYYFGISKLAALSSSNIEQFLALAGELFEEIVSVALLRRQIILTADRQQSILKRVAQQRWQDIPRRIPNGRDAQRLLEAIQECARWETNKPSAPYAPGVTGIAITMADLDTLLDPDMRLQYPDYRRLTFILSSCLAHNLLEAVPDRRQGQKGQTWMILYLNRWLCLHFGLPLQYGGWRPKTRDELCGWLKQGFRPPSRSERTLL